MKSNFERASVIKNLPKKGFKMVEDSKHIVFFHEYQGKETGVKTYVSHSPKAKVISGDLVTHMRKQLRLESSRDVVNLVECPMTAEGYRSHLRSKGLIED